MFNSALRTRIEALEKRLQDMEDAHSRVVELEADWQDWLHKIRNVLARLNQRDRAAGESVSERPPRYNPAALKLLGIHQNPNGDE